MKFNLTLHHSHLGERDITKVLKWLKSYQGKTPSFKYYTSSFDRNIQIETEEFPYWILQILYGAGVFFDGKDSYFLIGSEGYAFSDNPDKKYYIPKLDVAYKDIDDATIDNGEITEKDISDLAILHVQSLGMGWSAFEPNDFSPSPLWNPFEKDKYDINFFENYREDLEVKKRKEDIFRSLRTRRQEIKQEHSKKLLEEIMKNMKEERVLFTDFGGNPIMASVKDIQGIIHRTTDEETLTATVIVANNRVDVDLQRFAKEVVGYEDPEPLTLPTSLVVEESYPVIHTECDFNLISKVKEGTKD